MKPDELEELLRSAKSDTPLESEHSARLLARVDAASQQPIEHQPIEQQPMEQYPIASRKPRLSKRNLALAASIATAASIGGAVWIGQATIAPQSTWAYGVEMDSVRGSENLEICLSRVESDVDGGTVSSEELEGSVLMMAEDRGDQGAIWFKTPKGDLGTCMVTYEVGKQTTLDFSALWSGPNTHVSGANASEQNVHAVVLKEDAQGGLYQEHTIFGLTESSVIRLQAEFANGTTSEGIVRHGLFFLMNRVEVTDPDAVISNADGATTRVTYTRADGSGFTETYPTHPDYQGNGEYPQIQEF